MPEKLIVVRDGPNSYVGYLNVHDGQMNPTNGFMLSMVRRILVLNVQMGPGRMDQQLYIFPIDEELGPVDSLWVMPSSYYFPSNDATERMVKLIERCAQNETALRAKEAGLSLGRV